MAGEHGRAFDGCPDILQLVSAAGHLMVGERELTFVGWTAMRTFDGWRTWLGI